MNLLKVGISEENLVDNYEMQEEKQQRERAVDDLRERIGKAKDKRIDRAQLNGAGLAEIDTSKDNNLLSTVDWVNRCRNKNQIRVNHLARSRAKHMQRGISTK